MTQPKDDLEAVRKVTETLKEFEASEQERIIRWSREKLGLPVSQSQVVPPPPQTQVPSTPSHPQDIRHYPDIQAFVKAKNPKNDTHFAATVVYYYRFEAPESERKEVINKNDLQEACREAGRERLKDPLITLHNAFKAGLLDKGLDKATFSINSVGENLVAMTLPGEADSASTRSPTRKQKKTPGSRKKSKRRK